MDTNTLTTKSNKCFQQMFFVLFVKPTTTTKQKLFNNFTYTRKPDS